jgi:putative membrane protein
VDVLAHGSRAVAPHDLPTAWNVDPVLALSIAVAATIYARGLTSGERRGWRVWCFAGGLVAVAVALVSPLEAMSAALSSAHMVQHVLLLLVAVPLLVVSAPLATLLRGTPLVARRSFGRWRSRFVPRNLGTLRNPVVVWLLHAGTMWFWHAAVPYNAALESEAIHLVEHATFAVTGVLFWRTVVPSRKTSRANNGMPVLLVFAMGVQSVFLSALLTFSPQPWYVVYAHTTKAWGLEPLSDQQLAGVIMWVPAGAIYVGAALFLLIAWLRSSDGEALGGARAARARNGVH